MQYDWTYGVAPDLKEERRATVLRHKDAWVLLTEVLDGKIKTIEPDYDTQSWAFKQAHQNGYNQAIRDVKKLLDI